MENLDTKGGTQTRKITGDWMDVYRPSVLVGRNGAISHSTPQI